MATLHTATLNSTTVFTGEYTLTKATGTTLKFSTKGNYSDKDIIFNAKVKAGGGIANTSDVTCITNNISNVISSTGTTTQPASGYYIGMVGSGSSTISTAGWMNVGALDASSTTKYFPISTATLDGQASTITAEVTVSPASVTMNTHTTTPSGKTSLNTLKATTNSALIDQYFIPIIATATANTTGTTAALTGTHTAQIATAGFAPTSLKKITNLTGTVTAKTQAANSNKQYIPIPSAAITLNSNASIVQNNTNVTINTVNSQPNSGYYLRLNILNTATVNTAGWLATNNTADFARYFTIPSASVSLSGSKVAAMPTVIMSTDSISGSLNVGSTITTVEPVSGFFISIFANAPETINIPITSTILQEGYLTGAEGEIGGSANTIENNGNMYYVPLEEASPSFTGGDLINTNATISNTNATVSSVNLSGISVQAHGEAARDAVNYNSVSGWLQKSNGALAYAAQSTATTWDGSTYYLNGVKMTNNHTFSIAIPNGVADEMTLHFSIDGSGNATIT